MSLILANKQDDNLNVFLKLITCLRMHTSNFQTAKYLEWLFGDEIKRFSTKIRYKSGNIYNAKHFKFLSRCDIFTMFFPFIDFIQIERIMISNHTHLQVLQTQSTINHYFQLYISDIIDNYEIDNILINHFLNYVGYFNDLTHNELNKLFMCVQSNISSLSNEYIQKQQQFISNLECKMKNKTDISQLSRPQTEHISKWSIFEDRNVKITIDNVKPDGNCFFTSIQNQFGEYVQDSKLLTPSSQRNIIQQYFEQNINHLAKVLTIWKILYNINKEDPETSFIKPFIKFKTNLEMAKQMVSDKIFLSRSFFAEEVTIEIIIDYVEKLINKSISVVLIGDETSSYILRNPNIDKSNRIFTFLFREPNHYSSMMVNNQRIVTKSQLQKWKLNSRISRVMTK